MATHLMRIMHSPPGRKRKSTHLGKACHVASHLRVPDDLTAFETQIVLASQTGSRVLGQPGDVIRSGVLSQLLTGKGELSFDRNGNPLEPRSVRIDHASVHGQLNLAEEHLRCGLALTGCEFQSDLPLNFTGATAPYLAIRECEVSGIRAKQVTTERDLELKYLKVLDSVRLAGARVGGSLSIRGSEFGEPVDPHCVLDMSNIQVQQDIDACGIRTWGEVDLRGGRVGGFLDFGASILHNEHGWSVDGSMLHVRGSMFCGNGSEFTGELHLLGLEVGGRLQFSYGAFLNPGGVAIQGDAIRIHGDLHAQGSFRTEGVVWLNHAEVARDANFQGEIAVPEGQVAIAANRAKFGGSVVLDSLETQGYIDLRSARCDSFDDDEISGHIPIRRQGFVYLRLRRHLQIGRSPTPENLLNHFGRPNSVIGKVATRLDWLSCDPDGYHSQPYAQLASVYELNGLRKQAQKIHIASERERWRLRFRRWNIHERLWSVLLDRIIGYGYAPWRAVLWAGLFVLLGTVVVAGLPRSDFHASSGAPPFNSFLFALDTFLPLVDFGYSKWTLHGMAQGVAAGLILVGWLLVTAIVAALGGFIRRGD